MSLPVDTIDAVFRSWDTPDSPGCALGVVHDGALAYTRGYGLANLEYGIPLTPASVFHVALVSKSVHCGCHRAACPGGQTVTGQRRTAVRPGTARVQCADHIAPPHPHTSGLRDQWDLLYLAGWREADLKTNADVLALARGQREVNFRPGTAWAYSNTGYTLLALVVERVTGQSLRAYADTAFFQPLGMAATHFHDNHREVVRDRAYAYAPKGDRFEISIPTFDTVGATSLFTTVEDLARWATNFFEPRIADRNFFFQLCTPGALANGERLNYAFGLTMGDFHGLHMVGHSGADAGYRSRITWFPEQQLAVIVLCNLSTMRPERLALQVAALCLGESARHPDRDAQAAVSPALENWLRWPGSTAMPKLANSGGSPRQVASCSCPGEPRVKLIPLSSGRFRLDTQPYEVEFGAPTDDGTRENCACSPCTAFSQAQPRCGMCPSFHSIRPG